MALSETDICNLALAELNADTILDLTEDNKAGRLCNRFYAPTRDMVLAAHPWNFAIRRAELAIVSTEDPAYEFENAFQKPSGCIRVIDTNQLDSELWRAEKDMILSNSATFKIRYIFQETDTAKFSQMFIDALTYRMASRLAYPLTGILDNAKTMYELYAQFLADAKASDAQEGPVEELEADEWLQARVSGPSGETFRPISS